MFQFFKTPFSTKTQIVNKFAILGPKFSKISVPKPQIEQKFSSLNPGFFFFISKNQFFMPLFFVLDHSLSLHLRSFGLHTYTKMKAENPPAGRASILTMR